MTILDDLFNLAEENWNSIQETADSTQQVVVYAAMAQVWASDLKASNTFQPLVPPIDRLIYNPPITPEAAAAFVSSSLTITAPNFRIFPAHPNYVMHLEDARPKGIPGLKHPLSVFVKSETPSLRIVKRAKAWW